MADSLLYHQGSRALQDEFASRALADTLEGFARTAFSDDDKAFIEESIYFFLATADAQGRPDCSFKGGPAGFAHITGPTQLAFPDYDGNGMFKSLGNILVNPRVAMLFIALHGQPRRLRVLGNAAIDPRDPLLDKTVGAQMIVRVEATAIFPNCPRYIPRLELVGPSPYTPVRGQAPEEPAWKGFDVFKDSVPPRRPAFLG